MAEEAAAGPEKLEDPWFVAVWPGMGNVALGAGGYLVAKTGARLAHELVAREVFDVKFVEVKQGVARAGRVPRTLLFELKAPPGGRDLVISIAEAQPETSGYPLCHRLLDYAVRRGARRLFTFAAMATQLHPSNEPRVFGAATDRAALPELRRAGVEVLDEGQISGLNGVLLAAGAERGIPGVCLLGELPFFAVGVGNPKASKAVLEVFSTLAHLEIDFDELTTQAEAVEEGLLELLGKMKEAARQESEGEEGFSVPEFAREDEEDEDAEEPADGEAAPREDVTLDLETRRRIEAMFEAARQDRAKAFGLKEELDRLGVFARYEDRFLDLFRSGE